MRGPAPEGTPARRFAREQLMSHAKSYKHIGMPAASWLEDVVATHPLYDVVGQRDIDTIVQLVWSASSRW